MRSIQHYILPLILMVFCYSCSNDPGTCVTVFKIRTTKESNHGSSFWVVVKPTDFSEFVTDDYQKIANEDLLSASEKEGVEKTYLIPGSTKTITLKTDPSKRAAIYFLFTHPGEEWKFMTSSEGNCKVKLLIGESEIKSTSVY